MLNRLNTKPSVFCDVRKPSPQATPKPSPHEQRTLRWTQRRPTRHTVRIRVFRQILSRVENDGHERFTEVAGAAYSRGCGEDVAATCLGQRCDGAVRLPARAEGGGGRAERSYHASSKCGTGARRRAALFAGAVSADRGAVATVRAAGRAAHRCSHEWPPRRTAIQSSDAEGRCRWQRDQGEDSRRVFGWPAILVAGGAHHCVHARRGKVAGVVDCGCAHRRSTRDCRRGTEWRDDTFRLRSRRRHATLRVDAGQQFSSLPNDTSRTRRPATSTSCARWTADSGKLWQSGAGGYIRGFVGERARQ